VSEYIIIQQFNQTLEGKSLKNLL